MKRLWTFVAAIASVVALVAVPAAHAAYTSAKFEVTQAGTTTTIKASVDPNDDPTAMLQIILPSGMKVTTNQAPGTALGRVRAVVRALDLAGEDLQLEGQVLVAAPGQVSAAVQEACIARHQNVAATWVLALSAAGRQLAIPAFFAAPQGSNVNVIYVCFGPPDVPVGTPGRAPFGAKLSSLEATLTGVFGTLSAGTWPADSAALDRRLLAVHAPRRRGQLLGHGRLACGDRAGGRDPHGPKGGRQGREPRRPRDPGRWGTKRRDASRSSADRPRGG